MVTERKTYIIDGERHDMSLFGAFPDEGELQIELDFGETVPSSVKLVIHSDGLASPEGE